MVVETEKGEETETQSGRSFWLWFSDVTTLPLGHWGTLKATAAALWTNERQ